MHQDRRGFEQLHQAGQDPLINLDCHPGRSEDHQGLEAEQACGTSFWFEASSEGQADQEAKEQEGWQVSRSSLNCCAICVGLPML